MGQRIPEKEIANFQFAELAKYRKQHKNNQQAGSLITRLPVFFYACKCHFSRGCSNEPPLNTPRACLKNHSRNLHAPLCGIFHPNSVAVARYGALIRAKYPTNCDAHLAESLFQTRSRACLKIIPTNCDAHLAESIFQTYSGKIILLKVREDNIKK